MAMTDMQKGILKAEINAKLCHTVATKITTPDEWIDSIEVSTRAIMEIIEKHDKEAV